MKYPLLYLYLFFNLLTFAQQDNISNSEIAEIFKEINETDGSHLKEPEIRNEIFIKNLDTIIWLIRKQGYPNFSDEKKYKKLNQSIESGTRMTFVHILQTNPELLLNKEIIHLVSKEIAEQRLDSKLLKLALSAYQYDMDQGNIVPWSESVENNFYLAIQKWAIKLYPRKTKE